MSRGASTTEFLVLLLVIVIGVAGGNLLSDWLGSKLAAYRADQGQTKSATGLRIPLAGGLLEQARDERRRDRDGVRLGQACEQWRQASAQLKSETARTEMNKHCGLYERYVRDGVLPGRK